MTGTTIPAVILSKDAILSAQDIPQESVFVPEWNGNVLVRGMSGLERDALEASMMEEKKQKGGKTTREMNLANFRGKLLVRSIVDPEGKRLFGDSEAEALGRKSAAALERVVSVAMRLSGLRDEDVEELVGNSDSDQPGGLPSS